MNSRSLNVGDLLKCMCFRLYTLQCFFSLFLLFLIGNTIPLTIYSDFIGVPVVLQCTNHISVFWILSVIIKFFLFLLLQALQLLFEKHL